MWNSLRCVCKRSLIQVMNNHNSLLPTNAVLGRTYAQVFKSRFTVHPDPSTPTGPDLTKDSSRGDKNKSGWLRLNDKVYPPQDPSEPRRPAFVCHELLNVKYSPKKMWYICRFIRGMTVDEALKQLKLVGRKGAFTAIQAINEAVDMAVKDHNVEYRTNLWIAECHTTRGVMVKGLRRHAKSRVGIIHYRYCNFYIRLEEGTPPADYYGKGDRSGPALLEKWLTEMRNRKITNTL